MRDHGGYITALKWTMKNVYNMSPGEVYFAASDVGWVVGNPSFRDPLTFRLTRSYSLQLTRPLRLLGHSYIVYAPLLAGCTTVLYEGKPVGAPPHSLMLEHIHIVHMWRAMCRNAGRECAVEGNIRVQCLNHVHGPHCDPRHQEGGEGTRIQLAHMTHTHEIPAVRSHRSQNVRTPRPSSLATSP